jgi:hypothetical protein
MPNFNCRRREYSDNATNAFANSEAKNKRSKYWVKRKQDGVWLARVLSLEQGIEMAEFLVETAGDVQVIRADNSKEAGVVVFELYRST